MSEIVDKSEIEETLKLNFCVELILLVLSCLKIELFL